jgi:hypothetical protein
MLSSRSGGAVLKNGAMIVSVSVSATGVLPDEQADNATAVTTAGARVLKCFIASPFAHL